MQVQTTDPRSSGLAGNLGDACIYVNVASGTATKMIKYGTGNTDWVAEHSGGHWGETSTTDPRSAGLTRATGTMLGYISGGTITRLVKYGSGDTDWVRLDPSVTPGAGLSDGDYGDVTVSGSGTTMTIDNGAVTYAKLQNVSATDKILGRSSAGAGVVQEIACTAAGRALIDDADAAAQRTTLGLAAVASSGSAADLSTGTLPAGRMPALTGDVTTSAGAVATTIAASAVSNAKMASMAAGTLKGNNTASTAAPSDLTAAQVSAMLPALGANATNKSIANTLTQVVGVTVTANTMKVGTIYRFRAMGLLTNTTGASTSVLTLRINSASLGATIVGSWSVALGTTARTNCPFVVDAELVILSLGATGTAWGQIVVTCNTGTALALPTTQVTAAVTIATNADRVVELTCISGATTTTWNFITAYVELVQP